MVQGCRDCEKAFTLFAIHEDPMSQDYFPEHGNLKGGKADH